MEPLKFEVGQDVRVTTHRHGDFQYGKVGVIQNITRGGWHRVMCPDGYTNVYEAQDLEAITGPW